MSHRHSDSNLCINKSVYQIIRIIRGILRRIKCKTSNLIPKFIKLSLFHYKEHGYWPDFTHPRYYSEKIQARKYHAKKNSLFTPYADKLRVRDYVKDTIGEEYLIPLLYTGSQLPSESLMPSGNFIIKATHDSGTTQIIHNGKYDYQKINRYFKQVLATDFGKRHRESWYSGIKPRIIIEQLLQENNHIPYDYKFHVFHGQKIILNIDFDRHTDIKRNIYDENLQQLPYEMWFPHYQGDYTLPANINQMFALARKLAAPFDYVRVDLYNCDGKIYFGELTFSPSSGDEMFHDFKYEIEWGNFWQYKKESIIKGYFAYPKPT